MTLRVALIACVALGLGCTGALARGGFSPLAGMTYTVPHGTTSGPVIINNPTSPLPTTNVVNNGTIVGGSSTGITVTGTTPTTVTNTGSITSSTGGVSVSGSSSSTVVNSGSIVITSTGTATSSATGISQSSN